MFNLCIRVLVTLSLLAGSQAGAQQITQPQQQPQAPQQFPFLLPNSSATPTPSALNQFPPVRPVAAKHGMVVTPEPRAARIGADILQKGGNAVDAAVAVGFALAVTYPAAGNIGGGGFMVIHLAAGKKAIAIDYRNLSPAATARDTYLDDKGEADAMKSRESGLAVGVP